MVIIAISLFVTAFIFFVVSAIVSLNKDEDKGEEELNK